MATQSGRQVDYIIVGGGTAGCVLAERLSEDRSRQVLLIEAGGEAKSPLVQLPVGFARLVGNPRFDWCYLQDKDASISGRRFYWSAGKLLGGGSSINGQVYIRGTLRDYDRWEELGATGWGSAKVWPYFLKSEDWEGQPAPNHGKGGYLSVAPMQDFHPLCGHFIQACTEAGLKRLVDYHGGDMEGVFLTDASQRGGWRCSTEKAYLRPARNRPNLQVILDADVQKLLFEGGRAVGVSYTAGGYQHQARAIREVIVSAGTVGSAALLLRSGLGPGAHLQERGVAVLRDMPGVGQNLQEHPSVGQNKFVNVTTLNAEMGPLDMLNHALRFFVQNKKGPLGAPAVQAMAVTRTRPELAEPDVQLHFLPLSYDIEPDTLSTASAKMPKEPTVTIISTLCQPKVRGRVELGEQLKPRVMHQFLGDERDVASLVAAQRLIHRLFQTSALRAIVKGDRTPAPMPQDDAAWANYVRSKVAPAYHPVGTCRMGSDADAVVDPQLRVKGVAGLRVIDASVMPTVTSTNTNAPTVMIAERGAEMIRAQG